MRRVAYQGVIVNVDGVLVDSPHELAWRDALRELMEGEWSAIRDRTSWTRDRLTPALYQEEIAGKARLAGARAALEHFGVPDVERRAQPTRPSSRSVSSRSSTRAGSWPSPTRCGSSWR